MQTLAVHSENIRLAYSAIKKGGLSLVKADIGYGLLGHSEDSIRKMYRLKGRHFSNPCIIAGNLHTTLDVCSFKFNILLEWIRQIVAETTIALVNPINSQSRLLSSLSPWVRSQATLDGTAAIFLNTGEDIEKMLELANQDGLLLVGSSGNISKQGNNYSFADVPQSILQELDYFYDAGPSKHANSAKLATTILNFSNFTIKRRGVNADKIIASYHAFAHKHQLPDLKDSPHPGEHLA